MKNCRISTTSESRRKAARGFMTDLLIRRSCVRVAPGAFSRRQWRRLKTLLRRDFFPIPRSDRPVPRKRSEADGIRCAQKSVTSWSHLGPA